MLHTPDPEKLLHGPAINVNAIGVVIACPNSLERRRKVDAQPKKRIRQGRRHHAGWTGKVVRETGHILTKERQPCPRHEHGNEAQGEPARVSDPVTVEVENSSCEKHRSQGYDSEEQGSE